MSLLNKLILVTLYVCYVKGTRPNIVFILADDLGWNDVGYHGSNQIPTPNIDALAYSGLPLHNYYVTPICTPSRSSLMTGKYAYHVGMQHGVIYGMEPRGLPLTEKILPQYLKDLGYKTHLVGKWHLGSYKEEYFPKRRGFDTHTGFLTGKIDMYDHTNQEKNSWGFDFKTDKDPLVSHELFGRYATDVFTDEAIKIVRNHNNSEPLFLMVAHSAVHSGNPYEPIRAPEKDIEKFTHINNRQRQKFAGVLSKLDESVGKIVAALQSNNLLNNSIIIFSTDNGGAAAGFNENAASNYPLRGVKNTLWEGGVRGAGLLWSPLLSTRSRVSRQMMHISDWLPTLYSAAGGDTSIFKNLDGFDQWEALSKDLPSKRNAIVHNIDSMWGLSAITVGHWKLLVGSTYNGTWDSWYGPSGRVGAYDAKQVYEGLAGRVLRGMGLMPNDKKLAAIREAATVTCPEPPTVRCNPLVTTCLYNIQEDPCELTDLSDQEQETLLRLLINLRDATKTVVPPNNKALDPAGDPKYWNRIYVNFGDFKNSNRS